MADEHGGKDGWKIERCYIKDDSNREMIDIIAGAFIVCYAPPDIEKYQSLPDNLKDKYMKQFKFPHNIMKVNNELVAIPYKPRTKEHDR